MEELNKIFKGFEVLTPYDKVDSRVITKKCYYFVESNRWRRRRYNSFPRCHP